MVERIQAIRGMNDVLPQFSEKIRSLEQALIHCLQSYGYQEIRFPIVEHTALFKRGIGEVTDIVEKEMYTFTDKSGDSLTLRPEGTASCLRTCIEHGLLYNQTQKLWYLGPMFRHERPQKGRYRQFHQFGVEAIGIPGVGIELELMAISKRIIEGLGLSKFATLEINSLGEPAERQQYKQALVAFLNQNIDKLDEESRSRLHKNPLRILDSKSAEVQALLKDAPKLMDYLGEVSQGEFQKLCQGLDKMGIAYTINPCLVRGLDYYGQVVFEWTSTYLGSQGAICAGGRYDNLVEQLGGQACPAIGFAIGIERIQLLIETLEASHNVQPPGDEQVAPSLFIIAVNEQALQESLIIAEEIHSMGTSWRVLTNTSLGGFKSQFKKADKSGAQLALVLGEDELLNQKISIKSLRKQEEQVTISRQQLGQYLKDYLGEA